MGWASNLHAFTRGLPLIARGESHGLATVVDSMRESIYTIHCDFLSLQGIQSERIRIIAPTTALNTPLVTTSCGNTNVAPWVYG